MSLVELTEEQKQEHRVIEEALNILDRISGRLENDRNVDPEIIRKTLDFLRTFADKCHHGKEQDLLFAALEIKGMSRKESPIGLLVREHEIARNYIQNMERALKDYKMGDETADKDIVQNACMYIELLRQHIDKEDDLLYPMAEKNLSNTEKKEILDAYDRFESEIIGEGVHERYHQMIEDLKTRIE
ncbi:hypothetical protein AKJ65_03715 [candidate division MSBL1 archaeon SCGC-AAA259E19]|uniref:Hemerythrin-like domain-containing protein n=1 Tax=candidate division MSBL1 archaeon SCGC-AAA259E19 TaxID=1698264 RepID=A0A133UKN5_9EURY|nr:hypothetical protein AKJ65_03715 [candidate division MSBL1 archaeon SCGC-AAA259E19]